MIQIRKAHERGRANFGWLDSHHTFSFGEYYDPKHMGVSVLRVINDDRVAPGRGFGTHPHRDMEILSYVLEGALEHRDSMGSGSVLRPGQIQLMSAGTGVTHSEFNHSKDDSVHFLQIWILPNDRGLPPNYQETHFDALTGEGPLRLIVSPDGQDGSLHVRQDTRVFAGKLAEGSEVPVPVAADRLGYLHVAEGEVRLGDVTLSTGDGAAFDVADAPRLKATASSEVLIFDLPHVA